MAKMVIQNNEKYKVHKIIEKIINNNFDETNIDSLFYYLRPYSGKHNIFREVAHFLAHSDLRDQGLTFDSLKHLYLSCKYSGLEGTRPSVSSPLPSEVKELIKNKLHKYGIQRLINEFGIKEEDLISAIDKRNSTLSPLLEVQPALEHLLRLINVEIIYTQEQILNEILAVIKENNIAINEEKLTKNGDKIILCILTLLHGKRYKLKNDKVDNPEITCNSYISYDTQTNNLTILGSVPVEISDKSISVAFPILTTNLDIKQWCEASALYAVINRIPDTHIGVNENFKLVLRKNID